MSDSSASRSRPGPTNDEIADTLERVAALLEAQEASPYRVNAYRAGARVCRETDRPLGEILEEGGRAALDALPAIGRTLAAQIEELLVTGSLAFLERLEGEVSPEDRFASLPGVGPALARRIHAELGVETLEELELAAHDGRLEALRGVGPRRAQALRMALEHVLRLSSRRRVRAGARVDKHRPRPSVDTLLEIDQRYREQAAAGRLRRIAPRRFNPEGRAWLPVLHEERDGWEFTALFSNTARAHELGRTRDWVVIYAQRDGEEDRCTVVTETSGPLRGKRVVRGREAECVHTLAKRG